MKVSRSAILLLILCIVNAADEVGLVNDSHYSMSNTPDFPSGTVSRVSTDGTKKNLVVSSHSTMKFYNINGRVINNQTSYSVLLTENILSLRYRSDAKWLAICGETSNLIYFMKQSDSSLQYSIDHTVEVDSHPNSLDWAYHEDSLAVGLSNGNIVVLELNLTLNKFSIR